MKHKGPMTQQFKLAEERINQAIMNSMGAFIRDLMENKSVIEIMLNPDGKLWVEYLGTGIKETNHKVPKEDAESLIRLIASEYGVKCNYQNPSLSAILPLSHARFQAFVPPVVDAPTFTIRKRALEVFSLDDYVAQGIINNNQKLALMRFVEERKNILIVGGTGSGKTTLANALLKEMAKTGDRIVTIEDTPELQCTALNKVQMYTKQEVDFSMQKAIKGVLRFRPDRIVIGEVRDKVALDLLKAWNTGHSGGVATIHANDAILGLKRLESLISEAVLNVPKDLIAEAINIVIYIRRLQKSRCVEEMIEIKGLQNNEYIYEILK